MPPSVLYCLECLPSGTTIYTSGSISNISCLGAANIGQKYSAITHKGKIERIEKWFNRDYDGELVHIDFVYTNIPLKITPEHSIYGVKNVRMPQKCWRKKGISEEKLEWIPSGELTKNDFIAFPRIKEIKDLDIITPDFAELLGWYVSEGSYTKQKRTIAVTFSLGNHEKENITQVSNLIENCFGKKPSITTKGTDTRITLSNKYFSPIFEQFGVGARHKKIPKWFFYLSYIKQTRFFIGLIKGDGYKTSRALSYCTTSKKLAYQLRLILFRLGILHGVCERKINNGLIDGRIIHPNGKAYHISISGDSARIFAASLGFKYEGGEKTSGNFGWVSDNYVFIPIKSITKERFKGKVYNIHVTSDESYLTIHGALHNCFSKHIGRAKEYLGEGLDFYHRDRSMSNQVQGKMRAAADTWGAMEDDMAANAPPSIRHVFDEAQMLRKEIGERGLDVGRGSVEDIQEMKSKAENLSRDFYDIKKKLGPLGPYGEALGLPLGEEKVFKRSLKEKELKGRNGYNIVSEHEMVSSSTKMILGINGTQIVAKGVERAVVEVDKAMLKTGLKPHLRPSTWINILGGMAVQAAALYMKKIKEPVKLYMMIGGSNMVSKVVDYAEEYIPVTATGLGTRVVYSSAPASMGNYVTKSNRTVQTATGNTRYVYS